MSIRTKLNPIGGLLPKDPFIFTITPNESNQYTIKFPTRYFINPIKVYWGDGTYESINDTFSITHTYPNQNDYSIEIHSITGKMPIISFNNDTQLKEVNTALLKCYSSKINITINFLNLFFSCTSLQSIPENLFINNPQIEYFNRCFLNCTSLQSIPGNLFINNINASSFDNCFSICTSLQSIPENLFINNINASNFYVCFGGCTSLQSIPENLFINNINASNFTSCFYHCASLQSIPENLFINNINASNFDLCFYRCSNVTSSVPELWVTHPNATHNQCFSGCTQASNYNDIPEDWK